MIQLSIQGMSCQHCAGSVQKALQAVDGVDRVEVDLQQGSATVHTSGDQVSKEQLIQIVKEQGYEAS